MCGIAFLPVAEDDTITVAPLDGNHLRKDACGSEELAGATVEEHGIRYEPHCASFDHKLTRRHPLAEKSELDVVVHQLRTLDEAEICVASALNSLLEFGA